MTLTIEMILAARDRMLARANDPPEPMIVPQWFKDLEEQAERERGS